MTRALFITFEGGEGAGKTTQIKRLAQKLGNCVITREPGGTPEAEALRDVFIDHHGQDWPPIALLLLMFTARALHTEKLIKPTIAQGRTVLCDRYTDSTRVYQGYAGGLPLKEIETVKKSAIGDFEPDLTFILDIDPALGLNRAGARKADGDTFESKDMYFHTQIRKGFLDIANKNPSRCVILDATQSEDAIAEQILKRVNDVR
ncbi:MAG TPA: dTMP kinase [Micavibrio sp.]|nr:dTMP kinase [Micavibrio sp.]